MQLQYAFCALAGLYHHSYNMYIVDDHSFWICNYKSMLPKVEISFLTCYIFIDIAACQWAGRKVLYTNFENLMSKILENMPCFNYCIYSFEHLGDYYWNIFSSFFIKSFSNLKYLFKKEEMLLLPRFELKTWLFIILTTTPEPIVQMI